MQASYLFYWDLFDKHVLNTYYEVDTALGTSMCLAMVSTFRTTEPCIGEE